MAKCNDGELLFGQIGRLAVQARFDGGDNRIGRRRTAAAPGR